MNSLLSAQPGTAKQLALFMFQDWPLLPQFPSAAESKTACLGRVIHNGQRWWILLHDKYKIKFNFLAICWAKWTQDHLGHLSVQPMVQSSSVQSGDLSKIVERNRSPTPAVSSCPCRVRRRLCPACPVLSDFCKLEPQSGVLVLEEVFDVHLLQRATCFRREKRAALLIHLKRELVLSVSNLRSKEV